MNDVTGDFRWRYDELYTLEVHYDGEKKAYCTINGEAQKSLDAGPRSSGGVFLFVCSLMRFQLHEIVIEGRLGAATLNRLRDEWMGREIAASGSRPAGRQVRSGGPRTGLAATGPFP